MIYGVGCYRSATKSLARQLGGVHEPQPQLGEDAPRFQRNADLAPEHRYDLACRLTSKLTERLKANTPMIDPAHSYVIPLILQIDPGATFAWSVRNPFDVIASLVFASSVWTEHDPSEGKKLIYPPGGWHPHATRLEKATYYWTETNRIVRDALLHSGPVVGGYLSGPLSRPAECNLAPFTTYRPEDLDHHTNHHNAGPWTAQPDRRFTTKEANYIADKCWGLWEEIS